MMLDTPKVMGILNVTPDSFFDGGRYNDEAQLLSRAEKMLKEGADIIDVGGYSSRPGAEDVSEGEEITRVVNAVDIILKEYPDTLISVDTFRSKVAREAVMHGAALINDISAGTLDTQMFATVADLGVPYILMHMRGNPKTMNKLTQYDNLLLEMVTFLQEKVSNLREAGVKDIIIDPGFGFAKTIQQNYTILKNLRYFEILELPILVGISRKSTIYKSLQIEPEDALNGTTVLNTIALMNGASFLRVHDVKEAVEVRKLYNLTVL